MADSRTPDRRKHNPDPDYLRELIKRAGITQAEAADRTGVHPRTMRHYLSHKQTGRQATYSVQYILERLADAKKKEKTK